MAERVPVKDLVGGSNPSAPANLTRLIQEYKITILKNHKEFCMENGRIESSVEGIVEDTTVSMNEWIRSIQTPILDSSMTVYVEAGVCLQDYIDGWMTGPVGIYKGRSITAESKAVSSIDEFREFLQGLPETTRFIMYMPIYNNAKPEFEHKGNGEYEYTGESESSWLIRGCFVEETT